MMLPVAAAMGPHLFPLPIFGVNVFFFRLLVIGLLIMTPILSFKIHWWGNSIARYYIILGYIWVVWAGLSIFWAPDFASALRDFAAVGFGFAVALALLNLRANTEAGIEALRRGWVLAFLAAAGIAIWELTTGQHLPGAYVESAPDYALRGIVISTFGNPNDFGAFIVIAFPFLLLSYRQSESVTLKTAYIALMMLGGVFVLLTSSRAALLGLLAQMLVFLYYRPIRVKVAATLIVLTAGYVFLMSGAFEYELRILAELESLTSSRSGSSVGKRIGLMLNGLWMAAQTGGLGTGAGSFEEVIRSGAVPFSTGGITDPHNFYIEVLAEYGVLIAVGFLIFGYKLYKVSGIEENGLNLLLIGLAGYLFAAVASSSYVEQSVNWMFLGSLMCVGAMLNRETSHKEPPTSSKNT